MDGELSINTIFNYKYDNSKNDVNRLCHEYQFYDNKNILLYSITLDNHDFSIFNFDENILNVNDNFCFNLNNTYDKIKIVLSLTRINEWGNRNIKLEMINDNSISIIYKEEIGISKKFDQNDKKLFELKEKISVYNTLIGNNFTSILSLKSNFLIDNIWMFNLDFIKDINFTYDITKFLAYENNIIYDF